MAAFSPQSLDAIAQVVTGGAGGASDPRPGLYRSGGRIVEFFDRLGLSIGIGSRVPSVRQRLQELADAGDDAMLRKIVHAALDPRDYVDCEDQRPAVVDYLNRRFTFDGWELRQSGSSWRLVQTGERGSPTATLADVVNYSDYESVREDFARAVHSADIDPADAITAACSTVESVCKCILDQIGHPYPNRQDIKGLVSEVGKHLNLSPARTDLPTDLAADIKQVLSGLISVTSGIGALRTHGGDAHGHGRRKAPVDTRIARLAIHAASTVSLFFIETWNRTKRNV